MKSKPLREKIFSLCRGWELSGKDRETFCTEHEITLAKFGYWRSQYLAEQRDPVDGQDDGFVAITPGITSGLEIRYPNGVTVKVGEKASLTDLKALIMLV
ncbi:MAG: hypothetical protein MI921_21885 [Cytophagales bacterium]|nr:hypothetical protein [Cytophagales bacterium]